MMVQLSTLTHIVTDRRTDRQTERWRYDANSREYTTV